LPKKTTNQIQKVLSASLSWKSARRVER